VIKDAHLDALADSNDKGIIPLPIEELACSFVLAGYILSVDALVTEDSGDLAGKALAEANNGVTRSGISCL
jgi:hypothetical protein